MGHNTSDSMRPENLNIPPRHSLLKILVSHPASWIAATSFLAAQHSEANSSFPQQLYYGVRYFPRAPLQCTGAPHPVEQVRRLVAFQHFYAEVLYQISSSIAGC